MSSRNWSWFLVLPLLTFSLHILPAEAAARPPQEPALRSERSVHAPLVGSVRKSLQDYVSADADGDGAVSSAEAKAYFEARFAVMDADRDQQLSGSEFVRLGMPGKHSADVFGTHPGQLSKFEALDLDGDGSVSPEEFLFDHLARQAKTSSWATNERERREATFSRLDADGAGFIDRTDFIAAGIGYFEAVDLDGDGEVTIWEFLSGQRL